MKVTIPLLIFWTFGCTNNQQSNNEKQILDFGSFTIEAPSTWKIVEEKGFDSYVGKIAIDSGQVLFFDLGFYSNALTEEDSVVTGTSVLESSPATDKQKKHFVFQDTINGRVAKIVYPINSGRGITGLYIDSLWENGSDFDKFNLGGRNLNSSNEKLLLKALKTLKFHESK